MALRIPTRVDSPPLKVWSIEDDSIDQDATPADVWQAYMAAEDLDTDKLTTNGGTPATFEIRPLSAEEDEAFTDLRRNTEVGFNRQLTEICRLGVVGVEDCAEWAPAYEHSGGIRRLTRASVYELPAGTRQWLGWATWKISQLTEKKS